MADDAIKDPGETLDYNFDWSDWLGSAEVLSSSSWSIPPGLTQVSASNSGTLATVWVSGGSAGAYQLTNTVITNQGRTAVRSLTLRVRNR